jgi:mono/diheme cytochrome c family protein
MPAAGSSKACLLVAALSAWPFQADADRFNLPEGPGRELVYGYCQTCHDLQSVADSAGIRRGAWDAVLDNMKDFGLRITDGQRERILDYLGTYLGPNPPPATAPAPEVAAVNADGAAVFSDTCLACHGEDGTGKVDEFPPLAGNPDLFLSTDFPAYVVINGIEGKLSVRSMSVDNVMPPFDFLSDDQIAAVIAYVRSEWGNDALRPSGLTDPDAADVATVRGKPMTAADVAALRESLIK